MQRVRYIERARSANYRVITHQTQIEKLEQRLIHLARACSYGLLPGYALQLHGINDHIWEEEQQDTFEKKKKVTIVRKNSNAAIKCVAVASTHPEMVPLARLQSSWKECVECCCTLVFCKIQNGAISIKFDRSQIR